jgi:hypothetical protein
MAESRRHDEIILTSQAIVVNGFDHGLLETNSMDRIHVFFLGNGSVHSRILAWTRCSSLIFKIFKSSAASRTQPEGIENFLAPENDRKLNCH